MENAPVTKNQHYVIPITDLGYKGEGIGKRGSYTLYVPGAIPGDEVEVRILKLKKRYGHAKLIQVVKASLDRIKPPCPIALTCGGCQIQQLSYKQQLFFKMKHITDSLIRIGKLSDVKVLPIEGMSDPFHYRNKAQFAVGTHPYTEQIEFGFYAIHSHRIINTNDCLIQHPVISDILRIARAFVIDNQLPIYDESTHTGLIRHLVIRTSFSSGKAMVTWVINGKALPNQKTWIKAITAHPAVSSVFICHNMEIGDTVMQGKLSHLAGDPVLIETIGELQFRISPFSFFQVNPTQTLVLYQHVLEACGFTGKERVWDLYCGIGSIALFLARHAAHVLGIECVSDAIADATENARLNGLSNASFLCGEVERLIGVHEDVTTTPDVVVLDPPRKGCEPRVLVVLCETVKPKRIVYVSCDPATFARDAAILVAGGYRLEKVQPVDLFPHTMHVEVVGRFELG